MVLWNSPLRPANNQNSRQLGILRHACVILAIGLGTVAATIYLIPYSLHRVVVVSYDGFDAVPNSQGLVDFEEGPLDFRLAAPSLSSDSLAEIRTALGTAPSDWELTSRCAALVRGHLNATDAGKPKAETADAEVLYRSGRNLYCLCSEHAILLNEMLQAFGLQSRVLWLEGHVAAEYFDRERRQWIFVDPHMNLSFQDAKGDALSAADLIYAIEREEPFDRRPLCAENEADHSLSHANIDDLWYRNILLNGKCYALSGTTLRASSRWSHLARFGERPAMLVLATQYNASPAKDIEPFRTHKCLLIVVAFVAGFYLLRYISAGLPGYGVRRSDGQEFASSSSRRF
jgi:hypothetical protein